ncbi:hypothetical protein [Entomomonas asaccharolytica]|uniref:Uncharacterized protein n=1 Tax=Entomomonas asaccharolytica TaxID=2785331 RepID=A0A974RW54_9GAMM|nr:hypothetical protein [Entomomonas asaccharolytica]QQP84830.1 hypothetical protein JHT90_10515 [Entomomonas asaccharolytica]
MTDQKPLTPYEIRKVLIKQQLQEQRQALRQQAQPFLKTGQRIMGLFTPSDNQQHSSGKGAIFTGIAIVVAILGKRRAGWLGKAARYIIINYPGLLHKMLK